jgi:hypothetical protein
VNNLPHSGEIAAGLPHLLEFKGAISRESVFSCMYRKPAASDLMMAGQKGAGNACHQL